MLGKWRLVFPKCDMSSFSHAASYLTFHASKEGRNNNCTKEEGQDRKPYKCINN